VGGIRVRTASEIWSGYGIRAGCKILYVTGHGIWDTWDTGEILLSGFRHVGEIGDNTGVIRAEYWIPLILVEYFYTFCPGYCILVGYEVRAGYETLNGYAIRLDK
jgi:hypothetical protein